MRFGNSHEAPQAGSEFPARFGRTSNLGTAKAFKVALAETARRLDAQGKSLPRLGTQGQSRRIVCPHMQSD